jgi:hypothetical protein
MKCSECGCESRSNPTPPIYMLILQSKIAKLARTYPTFDSLSNALTQLPITFTKDEFVKLLLDYAISNQSQSKFETLEKTTPNLPISSKTLINECRELIRDILYHFIYQHPINYPALSHYLDEFVIFLRNALESIYKSPVQKSFDVVDYLIHLESVYTVSRYLDPYTLNIIRLNNEFVRHGRIAVPTPLLVSFIMMTSKAGLPKEIEEYVKKCNNVCQVLNPFRNVSIYNINDFHGLKYISGNEEANMMVF